MDTEQQAILARDMIQMIRKYKDDDVALSYLESFAFAIARGIESDVVVNWDDIAGVCDHRYWSIRQNDPKPLIEERLDYNEARLSAWLPPLPENTSPAVQ